MECGTWNKKKSVFLPVCLLLFYLVCHLASMFTLVLFSLPSCQRYVHFIHSLHSHSFVHNNKNVHNFYYVIIATLGGLPYIMYDNKENIPLVPMWNMEHGTGTWNLKLGIWNMEHRTLYPLNIRKSA
jgi:hypothetical protein